MSASNSDSDSDFDSPMADGRPEKSVYSTPSIMLVLQDDSHLYIPGRLLRRIPKLPPISGQGSYRLDVTMDVGHVLAHYLFTNTYQSLRPLGSTAHERLAAEFTTSMRVYAAARIYQLPDLEDLAKAEINRLGDKLRTPLVFDLANRAYPDPSPDDAWLVAYLKTRLKMLLEDPAEPLEWGPAAERRTVSISDMLFRSLLELWREQHKALPLHHHHHHNHPPSPHPPSPHPRPPPSPHSAPLPPLPPSPPPTREERDDGKEAAPAQLAEDPSGIKQEPLVDHQTYEQPQAQARIKEDHATLALAPSSRGRTERRREHSVAHTMVPEPDYEPPRRPTYAPPPAEAGPGPDNSSEDDKRSEASSQASSVERREKKRRKRARRAELVADHEPDSEPYSKPEPAPHSKPSAPKVAFVQHDPPSEDRKKDEVDGGWKFWSRNRKTNTDAESSGPRNGDEMHAGEFASHRRSDWDSSGARPSRSGGESAGETGPQGSGGGGGGTSGDGRTPRKPRGSWRDWERERERAEQKKSWRGRGRESAETAMARRNMSFGGRHR